MISVVMIISRFKSLLEQHASSLAELVTLEHGKNFPEALASVMKGIETVEYATSMPQLIGGKILEGRRNLVYLNLHF